MLNRIKLTNFQRHRSLEVIFNAGITALRGSNEKGKSTLIRAICYALFGAKALPMSLDEVVTWGEALNTLKVELEFTLGGVAYLMKRGKSGAELTYDGGIVTGQNETTGYIARLLKADAATASRLMLANQNEIRGALEKGAAETTKMIEQLAEFDQLDNLLEVMQEKLTLGSTATAEAAIAQAEATLEQARAEAIPVDVQAFDARIAEYQVTADSADAAVEVQDRLLDKARDALNAAAEASAAREATVSAVGRAAMRANGLKVTLDAARAVPAPLAFDVDGARARIAELGNIEALRKARGEVEQFLGEPSIAKDDRYEGTYAQLVAEIKSTSNARHQLATKATGERTRAMMDRGRISTGACATCGQDISHLPDVAKRNATLEVSAAEAEGNAERLEEQEKELAGYLDALEAIQAESVPRVQALDRHSKFVKVVDAFYPPTLEWIGGEIPDNVDGEVSEIRACISEFEKQQRAYDVAQGQAANSETELAAALAEVEQLKAKVESMPAVDLAALKARTVELSRERQPLADDARDAHRTLDQAVQAKKFAIDTFDRAIRTAEHAEKTLAARRKELKELGFNNALMKAVRTARPIIADKLWNLVLSAVAKYFSEMRGVKSRVTKDTDGFKVDGHTASTLSGSTLDILGLAIRVALTRTFLPTAPFLVLDEPAAAMDGERTELMLGFLVTAGFGQTLLVTHEDISESVADNIITLA